MPQTSAIPAQIEYLADHPEALPTLKIWLQSEWSSWYGPEALGDVDADLLAYSNRGSLPIGLVAFVRSEICGFAVLKADAISGYESLEPWAGAAFVPPHIRNHGIGSKLVQALEVKARELGYKKIYAGTSGAANLLRRRGWQERGHVSHNNDYVYVYEKAL